jgi:prephenate dehydratase
MNITKIESRPIAGKPFEYVFHLDMECRADRSAALKACVGRIKESCASCRVLGFYLSTNVPSTED